MARLRLLALVGGLLAVGLAAVWWETSREGSQGAVVLDPDDRRLAALGGGIYDRECAACHGVELEGQADWRSRRPDGRLPAPPHDASGHTWHHPDAQLFALTKHGIAAAIGQAYESDMPAYAGRLSDEEIVAVLSYIKSRWPAEIRARHDALNARARQAAR